MFKTPSDIKSIEDVLPAFKDVYDNISLANINPSDIRTVMPSSDEVSNGFMQQAEVSGVPTIVIKSLSGQLFKIVAIPV